GLSVDSTFRRRSASLALPTTWPTMASADFCPAVRPPHGALTRRSDTEQISWGKLSRLPCTVAGSTLRILDGYRLRGKWPARPTLAPSYPVFVHRRARLLYASFRPRLAATALALLLTLHLHQVGWRTFTSELLNMPSTPLDRSCGRCARCGGKGEDRSTERWSGRCSYFVVVAC